MNYELKKERVKPLNKGEIRKGTILYWMSREQRINDNWSLIYALRLGYKYKTNVVVCFNLADDFLEASVRHFGFMLRNIQNLSDDLCKLNIPFVLLNGNPELEIPKFANNINASVLISDFDPLKIKLRWQDDISKNLNIPFMIVDSHNIVPHNIVSNKKEFAAYTIRPKINKNIDYYLDEFPALKKFEFNNSEFVNKLNKKINFDLSKYEQYPDEVNNIKSGEIEAKNRLNIFIENKLNKFNELRNNPTLDYISGLSPYLHFGQISSQRIAIEIRKIEQDENTKAFLEELIVRKELSDNYCFYNKNYDNYDGFPDWAKKTHEIHRNDPREYIYSPEQFENAETHDKYWNAAQIEMINKGKMHGYMRMYWAKKILEWTESPEQAMEYAITLNDRYELDGRDPNGYTGIAWSIGGVHDRAWTERQIYGKIRYMNSNGLKRKFDIEKYSQKHSKIL